MDNSIKVSNKGVTKALFLEQYPKLILASTYEGPVELLAISEGTIV